MARGGLVGYSPWGSQRAEHDWLTNTHCLGPGVSGLVQAGGTKMLGQIGKYILEAKGTGPYDCLHVSVGGGSVRDDS